MEHEPTNEDDVIYFNHANEEYCIVTCYITMKKNDKNNWNEIYYGKSLEDAKNWIMNPEYRRSKLINLGIYDPRIDEKEYNNAKY